MALDLETASLVGRRYRPLEPLGAGGMGCVYRALDVETKEAVALKIISPEIAARADVRRRFLREIRAVARLEHPNVVRVLDAGEDEELGSPFLALELVDGPTLAAYLRRAARCAGPELDALAIGVARGLDVAHGEGIVHRDIKPGNILVDGGRITVEAIRVCDFGLAKLLDETGSSEPTTRDGALLGTPGYMAPEQAQTGVSDPRGDLYALGVVLFEAATGERLFEAETPLGLLMKHAMEPPRPLGPLAPGASPALVEMVEACLRKAPEARPPSARAFLEHLERSRPSSARAPLGDLERSRPPSAPVERSGPPSARAPVGPLERSGPPSARAPVGPLERSGPSSARAALDPLERSGSSLARAGVGPLERSGSSLARAAVTPLERSGPSSASFGSSPGVRSTSVSVQKEAPFSGRPPPRWAFALGLVGALALFGGLGRFLADLETSPGLSLPPAAVGQDDRPQSIGEAPSEIARAAAAGRTASLEGDAPLGIEGRASPAGSSDLSLTPPEEASADARAVRERSPELDPGRSPPTKTGAARSASATGSEPVDRTQARGSPPPAARPDMPGPKTRSAPFVEAAPPPSTRRKASPPAPASAGLDPSSQARTGGATPTPAPPGSSSHPGRSGIAPAPAARPRSAAEADPTASAQPTPTPRERTEGVAPARRRSKVSLKLTASGDPSSSAPPASPPEKEAPVPEPPSDRSKEPETEPPSDRSKEPVPEPPSDRSKEPETEPPSDRSKEPETEPPSDRSKDEEPRPSAKRVRLEAIEVFGGVSSARTQATIEARLDRLDACLPRAPGSHVTAGGRIGFSGQLQALSVHGATEEVGRCVRTALRGMRLPRPDTGDARVRFKLVR